MKYIFDLDGTLTDPGHRLHLITEGNTNWEGFYAGVGLDTPHFDLVTIARALYVQGNKIVIITGRPERTRFATVTWLRKYRISFEALYMRPDGDHREDFKVKEGFLDTIPGLAQEVAAVFEDRQQCVDMYRNRGIRVYQVAKGDF